MVKIHTDKNVADLLTKAFDFWSIAKAKTINGEVQIHALVDRKKVIIIESSVRRDLQLADEEGIDSLPNSTIFDNLALIGKPKRKDIEVPRPSSPITNVADEAIYEEWDDRLVRAATTTASLEVEQDSGNTLRSGEDSMKLQELMEFCTQLQTKVLGLENELEKTKTTHKNEIDALKKRVKSLERRNRSITHKLKRLYKGRRIEIIDADDGISLVNAADNDMFRVNDLDGDEVMVKSEVFAADQANKGVVDEITLAQALLEIKSATPKKKREVVQEQNPSTTTPTVSTAGAEITTASVPVSAVSTI
ncbi:hypothetical protein Tco_1508206 [Tanacetum coccineum]